MPRACSCSAVSAIRPRNPPWVSVALSGGEIAGASSAPAARRRERSVGFAILVMITGWISNDYWREPRQRACLDMEYAIGQRIASVAKRQTILARIGGAGQRPFLPIDQNRL